MHYLHGLERAWVRVRSGLGDLSRGWQSHDHDSLSGIENTMVATIRHTPSKMRSRMRVRAGSGFPFMWPPNCVEI